MRSRADVVTASVVERMRQEGGRGDGESEGQEKREKDKDRERRARSDREKTGGRQERE